MTEPEKAFQKPGDPKKTHWLRQDVRFGWDSFLEFFHVRQLGTRLLQEAWDAIKYSRIIFALLLILTALSLSGGRAKNARIAKLEEEQTQMNGHLTRLVQSFVATSQSNAALVANYQDQIQTLSTKFEETKSAMSELVRERDKAQLESQNDKNAIAAWIMLAKSANTNTPLTERLDSLTGSLTNLLSGLSAQNSALSIKIDDVAQTNVDHTPGAVVPASRFMLQKSNEFSISAENRSAIAAQHISISFFAVIDPTNLMASGWQQQVPSGPRSHWYIVAEHSIGQFEAFQAPPMKVSTNFQEPFLRAVITAHADNSTTYECSIILLLQK
jgi:hypothetical protein